jgi:hypothetical protein
MAGGNAFGGAMQSNPLLGNAYGENADATAANYGDLGLGGSTMASQGGQPGSDSMGNNMMYSAANEADQMALMQYYLNNQQQSGGKGGGGFSSGFSGGQGSGGFGSGFSSG